MIPNSAVSSGGWASKGDGKEETGEGNGEPMAAEGRVGCSNTQHYQQAFLSWL